MERYRNLSPERWLKVLYPILLPFCRSLRHQGSHNSHSNRNADGTISLNDTFSFVTQHMVFAFIGTIVLQISVGLGTLHNLELTEEMKPTIVMFASTVLPRGAAII